MDLMKRENVPSYVVSRIGAIQQELEQLKRTLAYQVGAKTENKTEGIMEGCRSRGGRYSGGKACGI